jgi:hypothetical protein
MSMEANKILSIYREYLPDQQLRELIVKLNNEESTPLLTVLEKLLEPPKPSYWWKIGFWVLVVVHYILVCAIVSSFLIMPYMIIKGNAPWYLGLPSMVFIWFFSTSPVECKLTVLENYIRKKLGMKTINGFVSHYFKKPAVKFWKNRPSKT